MIIAKCSDYKYYLPNQGILIAGPQTTIDSKVCKALP